MFVIPIGFNTSVLITFWRHIEISQFSSLWLVEMRVHRPIVKISISHLLFIIHKNCLLFFLSHLCLLFVTSRTLSLSPSAIHTLSLSHWIISKCYIIDIYIYRNMYNKTKRMWVRVIRVWCVLATQNHKAYDQWNWNNL